MTKPAPTKQPSNHSATILAVDDEESIRRLLSAFLSPHFDCMTVSSAEEAFELLEKQAFRVVITDLKLPGASGFDVCRFVKSRHPETPVVMMTGMYGAQYASQALQEGVYSFLTKPIDMTQLVGLIESALRHQALAVGRRRGRP